MKVFDLQCALGHGFEGWFVSEEDFLSQQQRGLISCPVCDVEQVVKLPSAPRLNLGASAPQQEQDAAPTPAVAGTREASVPHQLQAAWLGAVRRVLAETEDVGGRFAEEARRMHYGEIEQRAIRGQTSAQEAEALHEEGIDVLVLPVPKDWDKPLQ